MKKSARKVNYRRVLERNRKKVEQFKRAAAANAERAEEQRRWGEAKMQERLDLIKDWDLISQFCQMIDGIELDDDMFLMGGKFSQNRVLGTQINIGLLRKVRAALKRRTPPP